MHSDLRVSGDSTLTGYLSVGGDTTVIGNTTLSGTLDVDDATTINDTLDVELQTTLHNNLNVSGDSTLTGYLSVGGDTTVIGNTTLSGTLDVDDATAINDTLDVELDTTLQSDLRVSGDSTLTGYLSVGGDTTVIGNTTLSGTLDVDDATAINDTLDVELDTTLHSDLRVSGDSTLTGYLSVGGDTTVIGNTTLSGTLDVDDATNINDTLDVELDTTLHSDLRVSGDSETIGTLSVSGDAALHSDLHVGGETILSGPVTAQDDMHVKGDLRVDGDVWFNANNPGGTNTINLGDDNTDNVMFHADINSNIIPNQNMAFDLGTADKHWNNIYTHDLSAHGDVNINNNLDVDGTLDVALTTTLNDDLNVSGETVLAGLLSAAGDATLLGTLDVSGHTTIDNTLRVNGNTYFNSSVHVDINFEVDQDTVIGSHVDINTLTLNAKVSGDVIPHEHDKYDLGTASLNWNALHVKDIQASDSINATGSVTIGQSLIVGKDLNVSEAATFGQDVTITSDVYWSGGNSLQSNGVYSFINTTSGGHGYANLVMENGKLVLDPDQVPELSITNTYIATSYADVAIVCANVANYIERGDVVIVTDGTNGPHTLIAIADDPVGTYSTIAGPNGTTDSFAGFNKLSFSTDYIFSVNGKNGKMIVLNPDDLDDSVTAHKFVTQLQKDQWDSVYSFVNADSATNNTDYNQTTFVNASGDTITGDLVIDENLHVRGDLTVDGNAYLSAGLDGVIHVGNTSTDNVVFNADINSNIEPDITDTYDLGSIDQRWRAMRSLSAYFDNLDVEDLNVYGVTTLSGKSDHRGPGVVIQGNPTGIFDADPYGFDDLGDTPRIDYMFPDVDITGDVALHGSLSAQEAHIYSLTASKFKAEYLELIINEGDLTVLDGNIKQRGGKIWIESDIIHIDDENTYMRFEKDRIEFVAHDVRMIQMNENPVQDDIIIIGDTHNAVNYKIQNPADEHTMFIDGSTGLIGIGTHTPQEKLHVQHGQAQFATGVNDGAVMITTGDTDQRVDKPGSIRYNTELERYEGYLDESEQWVGFGGAGKGGGDTDGDTFVDVDAGDYVDSDVIGMYTAGCSAMAIYPNQTVAFAGDIQFDNVTVYDNDSVTGPLTATSEFLYLKVNGKDRAIRLWATPEDTEQDLETIHGESISWVSDECAHGLEGNLPVQTISAHPVLNSPPTQGIDTDSDGDWIVDAIDPDDDNDGIPDYADVDHPSNLGATDTDGDGIIDLYDSDVWTTGLWGAATDNWQQYQTNWENLSGN